ncbi:hypothetical protein AHAS_Ahas09G0252800 [Arachis hypogaea]
MYKFVVLVFILVVAAATGERRECPASFNCGYVGNISFPLTTAERQECGLLAIHNCSESPQVDRWVQLSDEGKTFLVIRVSQQNFTSIQFRDKQSHQILCLISYTLKLLLTILAALSIVAALLLLSQHGSLPTRQYKYSEIQKFTDDFKVKLGQGGYGTVYKGKLQDDSLVAVKVLSEVKGTAEEFINEVASISRTSHVNIVSRVGFCFQGSKRALIYEFMPKGFLEKFICEENSTTVGRQLDSRSLYDIAVDFGLAKICPRKESIVSMSCARGTIGFIAPELFSRNFGGISHKADVYSYGMMVLEMVGGRNNKNVEVDRSSELYFPDWIYKRLELDEELGLRCIRNESDREIVRKMTLVSLWCIQTNPSSRPSMSKVVEMLDGSLELFELPPRPFFSSSPTSPINCSSHTSESL